MMITNNNNTLTLITVLSTPNGILPPLPADAGTDVVRSEVVAAATVALFILNSLCSCSFWETFCTIIYVFASFKKEEIICDDDNETGKIRKGN